MYKVKYDKKCKYDKSEAHRKCRKLFVAGDAHRAVDYSCPAVFFRSLAEAEEPSALSVNTEIDTVYKTSYNLAKSKGYYGKIVTAKAQNGNTDEKSEYSRDYTAANHRKNKAKRVASDAGKELAENRAGKCSDAEKARMAETELAGKADYKVKGDCRDNINAHGNKLSAERTAEYARACKALEQHKQQRHHSVGY